MIQLTQGRPQALIARVYWQGAEIVDYQLCVHCSGTGRPLAATWGHARCTGCDGDGWVPIHEMRPRRFAFLIRWMVRPRPVRAV